MPNIEALKASNAIRWANAGTWALNKRHVTRPVEGVIEHWQIDFSKFAPLIIAELKSLRARLKNAGL